MLLPPDEAAAGTQRAAPPTGSAQPQEKDQNRGDEPDVSGRTWTSKEPHEHTQTVGGGTLVHMWVITVTQSRHKHTA